MALGNPKVDYFSLDIEGAEYQVKIINMFFDSNDFRNDNNPKTLTSQTTHKNSTIGIKISSMGSS